MSFSMVSGSNNKYSKVLWSPHSQPKFLVGGNDLRLYEYSSKKGSLHPPRLSMVAIHTDLPLMKCFDWSRDSASPNIVAVGQSTGKTCLVKLQPTNVLPVNASTSTESLVPSGTEHHLQSPTYEPSLSGVAGTILTLNVRHTRACNAVAFSPLNSHFLATGLEKVRNDSSLLVWDLNAALPVTRIFNEPRDNLASTQSLTRSYSSYPALDGKDMGISGQFAHCR
ncbi:hypothetical protein DSO57_1036838 [Entomophthora muscae]|uniref:Uncharacterized protein n=1 Tax=Entomophthora muscae TaxID=34485 RepID=A0ACC2TY76_9FUNG|nr:hypothetical protein DSO57_1036838 [Entomophthora muscae]